jgi:hypothetical protein
MKQIYRLYGITHRINRIAFLSVFSLSLLLLTLNGQAQVNAYARVTALATNSGRSVLTIANRIQTNHTFTTGEQVIVIQMKDNVIGTNTGNNTSFGNLANINNAGFYHVATIFSVTATTMTLTEVLPNKFTIGTNSNVQVVSFQKLSTGNFTTTQNITAVPWNGTNGTGGVIALHVPGTFTINHSITADGQGFVGGGSSVNFETECGPTVYITNSTNYGAKGEGIYAVNTTANPTFVRGRGKVASGGGGGSAHNAGGGGGSNYSAGGLGGPGWECTGGNVSGGLGGVALSSYLMAGTRVFMGGGGGGGQGNNNAQTAGANGGGIIIIYAREIRTGCTSPPVRISANGSNANNTTGTGADGAGGAGAGGTILLQVGSFNVPSSCALQIHANGGNGGSVNNADAHGGGAGGGQGAVIYSGAMPTTNITTVTTPGTGGKNSNAANASSAGSGTGTSNAGIISGVGSVLTTKLTKFTAERINQKAVLHWTAIEEANTIYTVQRATDGIHFVPVGTVKGTGDGAATNSYSFNDVNPAAGKNYYQLQISSGTSTQPGYSTIVTVNMLEPQSVAVAWPNPAHDQFNIRVDDDYNNKTHQLIITNLTGKVMYRNTYKPVNGNITVTPAMPLTPGLYIFKLNCEGYEQSGKLRIR